MHLILSLIFLAVLGVYIAMVAASYARLKPTAGTWAQHLWAAAENSATKLWARAVGMVAASLAYLASATDILNAPQVTSAIQSVDPVHATAIVAGLFLLTAFVTEWARNRTLGRAPVEAPAALAPASGN